MRRPASVVDAARAAMHVLEADLGLAERAGTGPGDLGALFSERAGMTSAMAVGHEAGGGGTNRAPSPPRCGP